MSALLDGLGGTAAASWAALAALATLIALSLAAAGGNRTRERRDRRLATLRSRRLRQTGNPAEPAPEIDVGSITGERTGRIVRWATWLVGWLRPLALVGRNTLDGVRRDLRVTGFYSEQAVTVFVAAKLVAGAGTALVALAISRLLPDLPDSLILDAGILGGAALLGSLVPDALLKRRARKRQERIAAQLPDAMDLLVICAEAGLTLESAVARVGAEIRFVAPELGEELQRTAADIRIAPSRVQAIENLAERTQVPAIRSMVATLVQAQKYGTPLGQSLRALSREFRTRHMRAIEERAGKLPTLLSIPLVTLILPALFIVVLGPALLEALQSFGS